MLTSILNLLVMSLKIFFYFFQKYIAWTVEERERFETRMKNLTDLLSKAIENKDEVINEKDYLSNLEWEKQQRYKTYKTKTLFVLTSGGGINELNTIQDLGMNLRVEQKKAEVIAILIKNINTEDKSVAIAQLLTEIV